MAKEESEVLSATKHDDDPLTVIRLSDLRRQSEALGRSAAMLDVALATIAEIESRLRDLAYECQELKARLPGQVTVQ